MIKVFCDFDGTVSIKDVGAQFFRDFVGEKTIRLTDKLISEEISLKIWLRELSEAVAPLKREEFNSYLDQFSIDPYFKQFVNFLRCNNIDLVILSDGLDAYIQHVLFKAGLDEVKFYANHAEFININGKQKLTVTFPYSDSECELCGNCKRNHMLTLSSDEDIIVYVGDGMSDRCPAKYSDFVFAKRDLLKHCQKNNITYFEYQNFADVQKKLDAILNKKRIRHRQEAMAARKEIFSQG